MSADKERPDDPVASALVDGSTYDRVRVRRVSTFKWPLRQKLYRLGGLLAALAAVILSLSVLPPEVIAALPADPYVVLTRTVMVAGIGVAVMIFSGVLLVIVKLLRPVLRPMDEGRAEAVLAFEEMWSLIGFIIGGGTATIATGFVLAAHAGVRVLEGVFALVGPMAFEVVSVPVPPSAIAVAALAAGLTFVVVGASFPEPTQ